MGGDCVEEKISVKRDDFVKLIILLNQLTAPIFNQDEFTIHIESKRGADSVKITYVLPVNELP